MEDGQSYKPKRRSNIGALWQKISKKNGTKFYTGRIDCGGKSKEIIVFENTDKTKDTHPDLVIRKQEYRERENYNPNAGKEYLPS